MTKESFKYKYTKPCLDWFEWVSVEIKPNDYCYFRIERRFGPSWWLIGMNPKDEPKYHWQEIQIGEISDHDLQKFIEWARSENGSKIIAVKAICGTFDIIKEISRFVKLLEAE